jgi:glutathione S-transferase
MMRGALAAAAGVGVLVAIGTARRRLRAVRHPMIVLSYLDMKGFGEAIRLALAIGSVPFEDRRLSYEEVGAMRAAGRLPYGQVPILQVDGVTHAQSNALLVWAGKRAGLYPERLAVRIDEIEEALTDVKKLFPPLWYGHATPRSPIDGGFFPATKLTEAQLAGLAAALNDVVLPERFAQLERRLRASGGPYLCGDALTTCDLSFYVMGCGLLDGDYVPRIRASVLDGTPLLRELLERIAAHPRVAAWNAAHA